MCVCVCTCPHINGEDTIIPHLLGVLGGGISKEAVEKGEDEGEEQ